MSRCKKAERKNAVAQYLFIIIAGLLFTCFSSQAYAQGDSSTMAPGRHRHERPPHPKPSLKKFFNKVNIFKKDKERNQEQTQAATQAQNTVPDNTDKSTETAKTMSAAKTVPPPPPAPNTTNASKKSERSAKTAKVNPSPELKVEGVKAPNATTSTPTGVGPLGKPATVKKNTKKSSKPASTSAGKVTQPII